MQLGRGATFKVKSHSARPFARSIFGKLSLLAKIKVSTTVHYFALERQKIVHHRLKTPLMLQLTPVLSIGKAYH